MEAQSNTFLVSGQIQKTVTNIQNSKPQMLIGVSYAVLILLEWHLITNKPLITQVLNLSSSVMVARGKQLSLRGILQESLRRNTSLLLVLKFIHWISSQTVARSDFIVGILLARRNSVVFEMVTSMSFSPLFRIMPYVVHCFI